MSEKASTSRREFLKTTGQVGVAATIAAAARSRVHGAQDDDTIQVCLVGCGGRGTGAAANAMSVPNKRVKLVGMADVMPHKLSISYRNLEQTRTAHEVRRSSRHPATCPRSLASMMGTT